MRSFAIELEAEGEDFDIDDSETDDVEELDDFEYEEDWEEEDD